MTAALKLGGLFLQLRTERPALLQATVEACEATTKKRLDRNLNEGVSLAAAQHITVHMVKLVVGTVRAIRAPSL